MFDELGTLFLIYKLRFEYDRLRIPVAVQGEPFRSLDVHDHIEYIFGSRQSVTDLVKESFFRGNHDRHGSIIFIRPV